MIVKSEQPKLIDLDKTNLKELDNVVVIISNGNAYLKQLPNYGVTEIHTKNGKVVKGDCRTGWII